MNRCQKRGPRVRSGWRASLVPALGWLTMVLAGGFGGCTPDYDNLRMLTFNTAFLYLEAEANLPGLPPCVSCNPLAIPPSPIPCFCYPNMSLWPNDHRYGNVSEADRAAKIADRILATDQEVVVLNEVFHPDARQAFVNALALVGPYKSYISLLRGHAPVEGLTLGDLAQMAASETDFGPLLDVILQDLPDFLDYDAVPNPSGLMIFSKYPFLQLEGSGVVNDAGCGDPECQAVGSNNGGTLLPGYFAFKVYDDCQEMDCWASKGVGFVKIDTPSRPSYVAFTHLQADYPEDGIYLPGVRAHQYEEIRDVILGAIPAAEVPDAAVYLLGDMNTVGQPRTSAQTSQTQEWHDAFNPASNNPNVADGFFACGNGVPGAPAQTCRYGINGTAFMTDSWGFETSPTDPGISNYNDGVRLDYVMHSSVGGRQCMQHSAIAWDLQADVDGNGGKTWLSDHLPVRVDFGTSAESCSANDDPDAAQPNRNVHIFQFGPTNCAASGPNPSCHQDEVVSSPTARITGGGSFQWFRIDQSGTYSIDLDPDVPGENVDYDVYHHTDLSRPLAPFEEMAGRFGIVYTMPEPPYYIRTFAVDSNGNADRAAAGRGYTLKVHQHLCRNPFDACAIDPGLARDAPYAYVWPTTVGGNPGDPLTELRNLWFRFKTSGVKDGHLVDETTAGQAFPTVRMQMEAPFGDSYDCITQVEPVIEMYNSHLYPTQLLNTIPFVETQVDPADQDWDDDGFRDDLRLAPDLPAQQPDALEVYFLKVTRNSSYLDTFNVCNAGMTSYLGYHTDLTYFVPWKAQMWAELDDDVGGEDNIRFYMGFDDSGFTSYPPAGDSVDKVFNEPDSGSVIEYLHGYDKLKGYYVGKLWPNLWETDEEQLLGVWDPYPPPFAGIEPLSTWEVSAPVKPTTSTPNPPVPFVQFSDAGNADDADYYYYLWYKICHLETEPVCKNP